MFLSDCVCVFTFSDFVEVIVFVAIGLSRSVQQRAISQKRWFFFTVSKFSDFLLFFALPFLAPKMLTRMLCDTVKFQKYDFLPTVCFWECFDFC